MTKTLERGEYLFREHTPSQGFYVVQKGAINLHRINAAGKEQVIHIFRKGESFAEETLTTPTNCLGDARAVEPSQVLLIRKAEFLDLLKHQPELALRVLGSMAAQLRAVISQLEDCTLKDVETRFANWLLKHCPNSNSMSPVTIQLTSTKRLLAAELGTVSETFSRTLAKFREARILSINGNSLTLLNPAHLNHLFGTPPQVTWITA